jgi:hypothetical protein
MNYMISFLIRKVHLLSIRWEEGKGDIYVKTKPIEKHLTYQSVNINNDNMIRCKHKHMFEININKYKWFCFEININEYIQFC